MTLHCFVILKLKQFPSLECYSLANIVFIFNYYSAHVLVYSSVLFIRVIMIQCDENIELLFGKSMFHEYMYMFTYSKKKN